MKRNALVASAAIAAAFLALGLCELSLAPAAQNARGKSTKSASTLRAINVKAEKLEETIVKESATIAQEYEEIGQLERARDMFEMILKLNPDLPGVQKKVEELTEKLLSSNELVVEVDTARGWSPPVAKVVEGQTVRIKAEGDYRFTATATLGPAGFATEDVARDMAGNVPCGALMGLVVSEGKPGKPFRIGAQREWKPGKDGLLLLRVNVPPQSKCNGRLKVTLSGFTRAD